MRVILRTHVAAILVALIAAVLLVPPAGAATSRATATISLSRTSVISGESVRISGALSTRVARPTYLQRHNGTSWRTIQRKKSTSRGRYVFSVRQSGAVGTKRAYRVFAPRIRINGRSHASVASSSRRVTVVAQSAVLAAPQRVTVAKTFTVTATLRPVRAGRVSVLQKLSGGTWTEVKRGKQSSFGKTSFSVTESSVATVSLRVVAAASGGASAKASAPVAVKVLPPALQRVSESSTGVQGDSHSFSPSISADGRYVAFASESTNLVPNDTNGVDDVFVRDLETQAVERVSVSATGVEVSSDPESPSISANGRYVVFNVASATLDPAAPLSTGNRVFIHDRDTGNTQVVSVATNGAIPPNGASYHPSVSADGTKVAFASLANNLVPGDTNGKADIFVVDRTAGTTTRISVDSDGGQSDGASMSPKISADGSYVAYGSDATNLVPADTNLTRDVFLWSEGSQATSRVSEGPGQVQADARSHVSSISADGRYIAFDSEASNLVAGDTNSYWDAFVFDRVTFTTERISVTSTGAQVFSDGGGPSLSADGRYVSFISFAALVPGDTNSKNDVFVRDRTNGTVRRISDSSTGAVADAESNLSVISANGTVVAFTSLATNLVPGDTNGFIDVYARDLAR